MAFSCVTCVLDMIRLRNSLSQIKFRFPRNLCWIHNEMCKANGRIRENCDRDYADIAKYDKMMVSNCSLWLSWSKLKMLSIHEQSEIKNDWMNSTYFLRILESDSSSIFIIKLRISINFNQILGERANFSVDTFVKTYKHYGAIKSQIIKVQNIYFAQKIFNNCKKLFRYFCILFGPLPSMFFWCS